MGRLEMRQVKKSYPGGVAAAQGVDLEVEAGELFVLLGPSGSGKSTILRLISGLETPDSGSLWLDGERIDGLAPADRGVAMVFQDQALYPHLNVFENIAFGLRARRRPEREIAEAVAQTAAGLGLADYLERPPGTLSGGQKRRVALARAMVTRPRLFLLDEPFTGLDAPLRASIRHELIDLRRRLGATMILVTHDQSEALAIGERIAVIDHGRVSQVGRPLDVYRRPSFRSVGRFVGQPPMSFLPCLIAREGDLVRLRIVGLYDQGPWTLPMRPDGDDAPFCRGYGNIDLGLRPEDLSISPPSPSDAPRPTILVAAVVTHVEAAGHEILATLAIGPHSASLRLPESSTVRSGWLVDVLLHLDRACWFDGATGKRLD